MPAVRRKLRIHWCLDRGVMMLFYQMVPHGRRGALIERLISQWCVQNYDRVKKDRSDFQERLVERAATLEKLKEGGDLT